MKRKWAVIAIWFVVYALIIIFARSCDMGEMENRETTIMNRCKSYNCRLSEGHSGTHYPGRGGYTPLPTGAEAEVGAVSITFRHGGEADFWDDCFKAALRLSNVSSVSDAAGRADEALLERRKRELR